MRLADLKRYSPQRQVPRIQPTTVLPRNSVEEILSGEIVRLGDTSSFYIETVYAADQLHGLHSFGDLSRVSGTQFALLSRDPELAYLELSHAVFLDTETTGLHMGTGTYVFLVGAGYLDAGQFRVRQYFLNSPADEDQFLHELDGFVRRFEAIVSFNGKAFDWPMIENRFVLRRRRAPLDDPPHIDLLHPARRMWKRRLESCSLSSLEHSILQVTRTEEDVPGWLIPALYFKYQRTGEGKALAGVFYHNLQDILSLATLAIHCDRVIANPTGGLVAHALDYFALGRIYDQVDEAELAMICYQEALRGNLDEENRIQCLINLATLQKRERRWEAALRTWYQLIDSGGDGAMFALTEMAKYYEHVERDYDQAIDAVRQALLLVELRSADEVALQELDHRLSRLLNRAARVRGSRARRR